MNVRVEIL